MEATIVNRPDGWVMGIQARIDPRQADYKDLWESRFMPRHEEIRGLAMEKAYHGVYYPCGEPGMVDFVAGMIVDERVARPEGLVKRPVPGGLYASFRCRMSNIGPTWREIYGSWLPASSYEEDTTRPAQEYYPPEMTGPDSELTIFVAIKPKV